MCQREGIRCFCWEWLQKVRNEGILHVKPSCRKLRQLQGGHKSWEWSHGLCLSHNANMPEGEGKEEERVECALVIQRLGFVPWSCQFPFVSGRCSSKTLLSPFLVAWVQWYTHLRGWLCSFQFYSGKFMFSLGSAIHFVSLFIVPSALDRGINFILFHMKGYRLINIKGNLQECLPLAGAV